MTQAVVEPVGDDLLARQEAGAQTIGDLAEAKIKRSWLDLVRLDPAFGDRWRRISRSA